jgi:hypothetical protein
MHKGVVSSPGTARDPSVRLLTRMLSYLPAVARLLPGWPQVSPSSAGSPFIATGDRCTDGWRLGDQAALCQLGAIATFKDPSRTESLWRPFAGATIIGYLVSSFALVGTLL